MIIPYRIDTLFKHEPYANWGIIAITVLWFFLFTGGAFSEEFIDVLVLDGWRPVGLIGHVLVHAGFLHLLSLWVFGNAACGNTSNILYPLANIGLALAAATAHVVFDGDLAVGASGAVNGVVGMALAMYPLNSVRVLWWFWVKAGSFEAPLWGLALL